MNRWKYLRHKLQTPDLTNTTTLNDLRLKRISIGFWCQPGIPIASTGFYLTSVQETVELPTSIEQVELKFWIESASKIGDAALIGAEPSVLIRPDPFLLRYDDPTFVVRMKTADTIVEITSRTYKTEMTFNYVVLHAGLTVEAGLTPQRNFYFTRDGWSEVGVRKGQVGRICDPTGISSVFGGKRACFHIPDRDYVATRADAHLDLKHIRSRINVFGHGAHFSFNFETGSASFSLSRMTRLVTAQQLSMARQTWAAYQRGEVTAAALDANFAFESDGDVFIQMPVESAGPQVQAADVITPLKPFDVTSDVIFGIVQPVTSTLSVSLIDPEGMEITFDNLPDQAHFEETVSITQTQTLYSVAKAEPGN